MGIHGPGTVESGSLVRMAFVKTGTKFWLSTMWVMHKSPSSTRLHFSMSAHATSLVRTLTIAGQQRYLARQWHDQGIKLWGGPCPVRGWQVRVGGLRHGWGGLPDFKLTFDRGDDDGDGLVLLIDRSSIINAITSNTRWVLLVISTWKRLIFWEWWFSSHPHA